MHMMIVKAIADGSGPDITGRIVPMPAGSYHLCREDDRSWFEQRSDVFSFVTQRDDSLVPTALKLDASGTVLVGPDGQSARFGMDKGYNRSFGDLVDDCTITTGLGRSVSGGGSLALDATYQHPDAGKPLGANNIRHTTAAGVFSEFSIGTTAGGYSRLLNSTMGILCFIPDITKIASIHVYVGDTSFTNYWIRTINVTGPNNQRAQSGENLLMCAGSDWVVGGGSPSWSTPKTDIKIRVTPVAGQVATVHWHSIRCGMAARPKIVLYSDDGYADFLTRAVPTLDLYGFKAAVSVIGEKIDTGGFLTSAQLATVYGQGHDLCVHGLSALPSLTTYAAIHADVKSNRDYLLSRGYTRAANHYAYPLGQHEISDGDTTIHDVLTDLGFVTGRRVISGTTENLRMYTGLGLDAPLLLRALQWDQSISDATVLGWVDDAIATGSTLMILFHNIVASGATGIALNQANFDAVVKGIAQRQRAGLVDVPRLSDWWTGINTSQLAFRYV